MGTVLFAVDEAIPLGIASVGQAGEDHGEERLLWLCAGHVLIPEEIDVIGGAGHNLGLWFS